jgi:fructose-1,6-bisphosphatase/inositol monophosphatase family enzyme
MVNTDSLISELAKIADDVILPRYLALKDGDIEEKSPGEFVTIADREAEECITCYLDAIMISEEAVGLQSSLTDALKTDATCCLRSRLLGAGLHYLETSSTS